jgi:hypothetical protein
VFDQNIFTRQSLYKDNLTFRGKSLNSGKSSHQVQSKKSININRLLNPGNQNNLFAIKFNKHKYKLFICLKSNFYSVKKIKSLLDTFKLS